MSCPYRRDWHNVTSSIVGWDVTIRDDFFPLPPDSDFGPGSFWSETNDAPMKIGLAEGATFETLIGAFFCRFWSGGAPSEVTTPPQIATSPNSQSVLSLFFTRLVLNGNGEVVMFGDFDLENNDDASALSSPNTTFSVPCSGVLKGHLLFEVWGVTFGLPDSVVNGPELETLEISEIPPLLDSAIANHMRLDAGRELPYGVNRISADVAFRCDPHQAFDDLARQSGYSHLSIPS